MSLPTHLDLLNGIKVPIVGFGTSAPATVPTEEAVKTAIELGYRHFDLAWRYGVDDEVGAGLRASSIPRELLFITTKFWPNFARVPGLCLDLSLKRLNLDYVDLFLMHWPIAFVADGDLRDASPKSQDLSKRGIKWVDINRELPEIDIEYSDNLFLVWSEMEKVYRAGKTKSLGVSNFSISQLERLLPHTSPEIPLCVNQIEAHPWFPNTELINYCHSKGIVVLVYCPLGGTKKDGRKRPSDDPIIKNIAHGRQWTTGQVLQSWAVQRGTIPLGRSEDRSRMASNLAVGKLTNDEMTALNGLDRGELGRIVKANWS